jgi:hypothetical protein
MLITKLAFRSACALLLILVAACSSSDYVSEEVLTKFASENANLSKTISSNGLEIKITYRPTDLLVSQELKGVQQPSHEQVVSARAKYDPYYYFIIRLSNNGHDVLNANGLAPQTFSDLLQTISFRMGEFVQLTTPAQDTVPVADYVYNRAFGLSKATDLLFVFERVKTKDQDWIQINLDEFGLGIGKQAIRFEVDDLENTPKIFKL